MSKAEELLNSLTPDDVSMYSARPEVEEHIVVGNDRYIKVPGALKRIAVQHDHNVETVTFDCPRYWDDTDLSTLYIWINYIRKDRVTGRYLAKNKRVDENDSNMIHFDWTIGNEITEVDGPIVFLVCALKTNSEGMEEVHWNSEKCTDCFVSPGMECADTTMNEYPDIITDLLARMDTIIAANGPILDTSLTQAGLAADARATGEAINKVDNRVTEIIEGSDFIPVIGNPIHLKEASRNNANLTPIGVIEQEVIEGEAGISVVGEDSIHVTDVDPNKEASLFAGANTTQETREGYNLLDASNIVNNTSNGVTIDVASGYEVTLNGTSSTSGGVWSKYSKFPTGTYTICYEYISGTITSEETALFNIIVNDGSTNVKDFGIGKDKYLSRAVSTFELTEEIELKTRIYLRTNKTYSNFKFNVQIVPGTYTVDNFPPFEQFGAMPSIDFPSKIKSVGYRKTNLAPTSASEWEQGLLQADSGYPSDVQQYKDIRIRTKNYYPITTGEYLMYIGNTDTDVIIGNIHYYDANKNWITSQGAINNNISAKEVILTPPTYTAYYKFVLLRANTTTAISSDVVSTLGLTLVKGTKKTNTYKYEVGNKNFFTPTLKIDNTNISCAGGTASLTEDEYTLVATATDTYFGQVVAQGNKYDKTRGTLYNVKGKSKIYFLLTGERLKHLYFTFYNKDKISLGYKHIYSNNGNMDIPENAEYMTFRFGNASATVGETYKTKVMLSFEEITEYIKPQSQSLNLDIPEGIELNKLGNTPDKIDFTFTMDETGYKTIDRDSVKHVGNTFRERIIWMSVTSISPTINPNGRRFQKPLSNESALASDSDSNLNKSYMNRYKLVGKGQSYNGIVGFSIGVDATTSKPMLNIYDEKYNDITEYNNSQTELLAAYNAYLNTNETYIVYPISTPVITPITDETFISQLEALINIKPYEGVTNVFVTSEDDGACLPLTEFLYNYITAAPSVVRKSDVKGISGDSEILHTGKNIFNKDKVIQLNNVTVSDITNGLRVTSKMNNGSPFVKYMICDVSKILDKTICVSGKFKASSTNKPRILIMQCNESGAGLTGSSVYMDTSDSFIHSMPFVKNEEYHYMCVNLYANAGGAGKTGDYADYTDIQIEIFDTEADIPSDYSEPQNETINLTLPEGMELFEDDSIFNEEGKWYHDKSWNKNIITGNEVIVYSNAPNSEKAPSSKTAYFYIRLTKLGENDSKIKGNIFCNMLNNDRTASELWNSSDNPAYYEEGISLQETIRIRINKTRLEGWSEDLTNTEKQVLMQNYLKSLYESGNPLEIVYKLAQPTKEEITDATLLDQLNKLSKLKTYKGVNNFFLTSAGADGLMKLEYRKFDIVGHEDIEKYEERIDGLESEMEELKDDIKEDVNTTLENLTSNVSDLTETVESNKTSSDSSLAAKTVYNDFVITKSTHTHGGNNFVIATSHRNSDLYATITKSGYYPIALLGVRGTNAEEKYNYRYGGLTDQAAGTCKAHWIFTNIAGESKNAGDLPSCEVTVLWVKIR